MSGGFLIMSNPVGTIVRRGYTVILILGGIVLLVVLSNPICLDRSSSETCNQSCEHTVVSKSVVASEEDNGILNKSHWATSETGPQNLVDDVSADGYDWEFVIASYNPNIRRFWKLRRIFNRDELRDARKRWIIYNKNDKFNTSNEFPTVDGECLRENLPNVGREGHTYLHHILTNYDNLAEHTLFCQENPNGDTESAFRKYFAPNLGFLGLGHRARCDCARCTAPFNISGLNEMWMLLEYKPCQWKYAVSLNGCFIASRKRIRQRPKQLYQLLMDIILCQEPEKKFPYWSGSHVEPETHRFGMWTASNPYFGHVLERSWNILLNCTDAHECLD